MAATGAFQLLEALARRLCGNSRRERSLRQKGSKSHRASSPAGAQNWPVRWDGHGSSLQFTSTALRPSLSSYRCVLRSSLCCWCSSRETTLLGHRFPCPTVLLQLEQRVPVLEPTVTATRWKAGFYPGPWSRFDGGPGFTRANRRAGARRSISARRLRTRAAFAVRQRVGGVEERYRARSLTAPRLPSYKRPDSLVTRRHCCWKLGPHPRGGRNLGRAF